MSELVVYFVLISTLAWSLYFLRKWVYKSTKRMPPSPRKLPILGNLHQVGDLDHRRLRSLGRKYGPIMLLQMGSQPLIVVQCADAAKEIMKTNDLLFADKPHTFATKRLVYNLKDMSLAPYGQYWRNLRSITTLRLLSSKMVQSSDFIRQEETSIFMNKIKSCSLSRTPVNLSQLFMSLSNDVICRAIFGRKYSEGEGGEKFMMLLREVFDLFGCRAIDEFIPWLWWVRYVNGFNARLEKAAADIDRFLDRVVEDHIDTNDNNNVNYQQQSGDWESFFHVLVDIYKDKQAAAAHVSIDRDAIKALVLDLLDGGTDTTSANLEWAMTEILRHPKVLSKLQNEVREVMTRREEMMIITEDDLKEMHYLKAVVKETLRLHPPVATVGRLAREDVKVMGYDIPRGTMFLINNWAIDRDPESWDEPDEFRPERFLISPMDSKGHDFKFLPFGSGRRGCPGITFAMANVELVLANLMHKFEWELPGGTKPEDLDMTEELGTAVHRKYPLLAVATHSYF